MSKSIYLAGPDVFLKTAGLHFDGLESLCQRRGLVGVRPSDGDLGNPAGRSPAQIAQDIYQANIQKIRQADAVLANLVPFRNSLEPDSGTVFEVGFAVALGIPVVGVVPELSTWESRIARHCGQEDASADTSALFDARHGMLIESFGLPLNLMLACPLPLFERTEDALDHLVTRLRNPQKPGPKNRSAAPAFL